MAKQKTIADRILTYLSGRKRGVSADSIADNLGVPASTVRTYLSQFSKEGTVQVAGKIETGQRGRPAYLYVA